MISWLIDMRGQKKNGKLREKSKKLKSSSKSLPEKIKSQEKNFNRFKSVDKVLLKIANELIKKYDGLIKAIWTYGSYSRGDAKPSSDIDIMILIDDVTQKINIIKQNEIYLFSKFISEKMMSDNKIKNEIHLQPPKTLTDWWDLLRSGEPWVFTGMRDSKIIYDPSGFVEPIKRLLIRGSLHGTKEKGFALLKRAKNKYEKLRKKMMIDVMSKILNSMVETTQAVLIYYGEAPVYEDELVEKLRDLVKKKLIKETNVLYLEDIYRVNKLIENGDIRTIKVKDIERYISRGMKFIESMEKLFERLEIKKKKGIIKKSHDKMMKIAINVLKSFNIKAKNDKDVVRKLNSLVKKGYITPLYVEFIKHILDMKNEIDKGNMKFLSEKDIYNSRMYVKTLESLSEMIKNEKK